MVKGRVVMTAVIPGGRTEIQRRCKSKALGKELAEGSTSPSPSAEGMLPLGMREAVQEGWVSMLKGSVGPQGWRMQASHCSPWLSPLCKPPLLYQVSSEETLHH